jgi:hypothetical protein
MFLVNIVLAPVNDKNATIFLCNRKAKINTFVCHGLEKVWKRILKHPLVIVTNRFIEQGSKQTGTRFSILPPFSATNGLKERILSHIYFCFLCKKNQQFNYFSCEKNQSYPVTLFSDFSRLDNCPRDLTPYDFRVFFILLGSN